QARVSCAVVPWDCQRRPFGSDAQSEGSDCGAEFLSRGYPVQSLQILPRLDRRKMVLIQIMRGFGLGAGGRDVLKCLPGPRQNGGRAGRSFEPPEDHIAVVWIIFDETG